MNRLTHELQSPSQTEAMAATKQEMKMVPRRAKYRFRGSVNQQPKTAQAKYGAPTTRPVRVLLFSIPRRYASLCQFSILKKKKKTPSPSVAYLQVDRLGTIVGRLIHPLYGSGKRAHN